MEVEPITVDPDEAQELQLALKNLEERRRQKRQKRIITIVIVCAVSAALIIGFFVMRALSAPKQEDVSSLADLAIPSAASAGAGVQASGTLKPGTSAVATAEVPGVITSVLVKEGQQVNAGDVLFTLRSSTAEKTLSDAQTGVDRAQRSVDRAQSDVARAQQEYDTAVNVYNAAVDAYNNSLGTAASAGQAAYDTTYKKAIAAIPSTATDAERKRLTEEAKAEAQLAYDEAYQAALAPDPGSFDHSMYTAAIDAANNTVTTANESLEDARKTYAQAQDEMGKCQVRAPRSGTVLSLSAVVGSEVGNYSNGSSSSEGTATIGDLSSFEVDVEVNEIDVSAVKVGQTAEVTFSAFPDLQENAEVVSVAAASTSSSSTGANGSGGGSGSGVVTFTVKLVIKQPDTRLKAGMSANVKILTEGADTTAKGPASASGASGAAAEALGTSGSSSAANASGASSAASASSAA